MPYSITTKDGITINNIPDDIAPDAQVLRDRVAQERARLNTPQVLLSLKGQKTEVQQDGIDRVRGDSVDIRANVPIPQVAEGSEFFGKGFADLPEEQRAQLLGAREQRLQMIDP